MFSFGSSIGGGVVDIGVDDVVADVAFDGLDRSLLLSLPLAVRVRAERESTKRAIESDGRLIQHLTNKKMKRVHTRRERGGREKTELALDE